MANPVLHIKDSYYFEVPKRLWPSSRTSQRDFPDVWVSLDPDFQEWEFERLYAGLANAKVSLPELKIARADWESWVHGDSTRHGKPFDEFLESLYDETVKAATVKGEGPVDAANLKSHLEASTSLAKKYSAFIVQRSDAAWSKNEWAAMRHEAGNVAEYRGDKNVKDWSREKVDAYNYHLSGKVVIPQPFGQLRNLYERDSGFCVSRFMIIELVVAAILCVTFNWLSGRVRGGAAPKGKVWNLLESFVQFIRDGIAEPAIGHHDSHRFTPLLCTLFFFILGCNLFGMIPWTGAPTGAFGTTFGLAFVTFSTVVVAGMIRFGPAGFFLNMVPGMDLPKALLVPITVGILAIEILGLLIKHMVLSIRLLANMVAGHLVLLGVMGLAFGTHAAVSFSGPEVASWSWPLTAVIAIAGSTLFSILELFVAFLQAYIFTFLSALFIGAAIHHH